MPSLKKKWEELNEIEDFSEEKQITYLRDVIQLYKKSPKSNGLLYLAFMALSLFFVNYGYWIVFGAVFWICVVLFIHTIVYAARLHKFRKKWFGGK